MANWKEYTTKTTPEDADEIMIADSKANASKRTPFSGLWNWIAGKLATAVISQLETQNKSIIPALNELNSKVFIDIRNLSTFSVNIELNTYTYASFLMYGATSRYNGFMYIVFVDVASEKRTVNFIKIADFVARRTFSGTYSDDTSTLTINASETIWGGIKMLMLK